MTILKQEIARNFDALKQKADPPPYFISYAVTDEESESMSATLGALASQNRSLARILDVGVRVGSHQFDSTRRLNGEGMAHTTASSLLPVDGEPNATRQRLWIETDHSYRSAAQRLTRIKTTQQVRAQTGEDVADFSVEEPSTFTGPETPLKLASEEWANRLRRVSAGFAPYTQILSSTLGLSAGRVTKYLVTTEGTSVTQSNRMYRVTMVARAKAFDGMDLAVTESWEAEDLARLPSEDVMFAAVDKAGKDLTALLRAPVVDPFVGPAILSGRAAGVFFHEIFGHRIEGHRQKDDSEGQTFSKSVGKPILPEFLSVDFDPTLKSVNGVDLNGSYLYDDEGIKARPLTLVDHGVLKTFLMSRTPVAGFDKSNGHGRRQPGNEVVSRQSNLIVRSSNAVSSDKLRDMLREELKKQNKPYGLYFQEVTGGYTTTGRRGLQAYTVIPLIVYRVFADGKPDELVRGADIVGTPLASFAKIVATSDKTEVFNGFCGAESGSVPVSAISPAILISEIEIQRKEQSRDRPPLIPRPQPELSPSASAAPATPAKDAKK
ncbi:MAG TPA: metallopeptidase TldD-related protein [Bryobacteraceae bacterium]|jgi:predicted Zn-dependent protease